MLKGKYKEEVGSDPHLNFCMDKILDQDLELAGQRLGAVSSLLPNLEHMSWAYNFWRQTQARLQRTMARLDQERAPD